jgi:hypothetical protein
MRKGGLFVPDMEMGLTDLKFIDDIGKQIVYRRIVHIC